MSMHELTNCAGIATPLPMQEFQIGPRRQSRQRAIAIVVGSAMALGGCVSVKAPDKPIVIELNINIKQEVVYRLAADAQKTIDQNTGIF